LGRSAELIGVVRDLIEVGRLQAVNGKLGDALTKLKVEHQAVKGELARLRRSRRKSHPAWTWQRAAVAVRNVAAAAARWRG
jgi:hypothetical protein